MSTLMRSISRPTSSARKRLSLDRNSFSLPLALRGTVCVFTVCALREQGAPHKLTLTREWRILSGRTRPGLQDALSIAEITVAPQPRSQQLYHNDGRMRFCSRSGRFCSRELRFRRVLHTFRRLSLLRISRLDSVGVPLWARGVAWWT
jgi:hypothetical protein